MAGLPRAILLAATLICGALPCAAAAPPARRASDIARAVLACWRPPVEGGEITVSLALRRDGSLIGAPRITYVTGGSYSKAAGEMAQTISAAIYACTPVALSAPLAAAIAGQVLRIRFAASRGASSGTAWLTWTGT